jgi:hypothetical protein
MEDLKTDIGHLDTEFVENVIFTLGFQQLNLSLELDGRFILSFLF